MGDLDTIREACEAAREHGHGIDPEVPLTLLRALQAVEVELLLLRDIVSDLDELYESVAGPLFERGHSCVIQRRVAQFMREQWKPNYEARGKTIPTRTWGRG